MQDRDTKQAFHWMIDLFERRQIPYQTTGGFAARVYGVDRPLNDIDFDVPEDRLNEIASEIPEEYIVFGPGRYRDDSFDIELISLEYHGQEIDIAGIGTGKIFDERSGVWIRDPVSLERAEKIEVDGREVFVIPKQDLAGYKKLINRPVDREDVSQLTQKIMIDQYAQTVWSYLSLTHPLQRADVLLVLGSHDLRVADYAAEVFTQDYAPLVVISGGVAHKDDLLETGWEHSEAEVFAGVMANKGVPEEVMLLEKEAQNTGDNFLLSKALLEEAHHDVKKAIVVTKPYMTRRAFATGAVQWPDVELLMTSFNISFEEYCTGDIDRDTIINIMVGDLQRIIEYPKQGFQIEQEVPEEVLEAFGALTEAGYDKHLLRN